MMNLIIKRGREKGVMFCRFYNTYGEEFTDFWQLSNRVVGVDCCDSSRGVFTGGQRGAANKITMCEFAYGHATKTFEFPLIDFEHDDVLTIQNLLIFRIEQVKSWTESVDWCEELGFSV